MPANSPASGLLQLRATALPDPRRAVGIALLVLALVGCQSKPTRDPDYAVVRPTTEPLPAATSGSLYRVGYATVLFEDVRARRVGDILTVTLDEATNAEKEAATGIKKNTKVSVPNPTLFGTLPQFNLPGVLPLASTTDNNLSFDASSTTDFSGDSESSQKNRLTGTISVTVAEVLRNGHLVVRGEKIMTLNQGNEHIRLSGIVRPADIRSDNTMSSTRIANATITYAGEGAPADASAIGFLARFLLSAFFPF